MSGSYDSDEVANPHRTQVDEPPEPPHATEENAEDDRDEDETVERRAD